MSEATYDDWDDDDYAAEDDYDIWDDFDYCYECSGYGDDYFINDEGELECACPTCPHSRDWWDDDEWDD